MNIACVSQLLLLKLFARHFSNSESVVQRLIRNLRSAALPFDVISQLREVEYPPYPTFECGLPSLIYYYLPGTNWGSHRGHAGDPLDPSFVYSGDGIGLNMGCPIRLANALEMLFSLPESFQKDCVEGLRNIHKHLPTVEELLWPTLWIGKSELSRGGDLARNGTNIDWFFFAKGIPVYLEAKFRPADWPMLSDLGTHQPMDGFFLGKAANKFTQPQGPLTFQVVGVTGTSEPTPDMLARCEKELTSNPTVHCILYKTLLGSTHVISLDRAKAISVAPLVKTPAIEEYPVHYEILWHRESCDKRIRQRLQQSPQKLNAPPSKLNVICVNPPESAHGIAIPSTPYRCDIERKSDGEPIFKVIPPYV